MQPARAYLDWNATTPLHPAAKAAMIAALDVTGNPSSIHTEGRAARALIETARQAVAALVGGASENVVFTSGASEAASALLSGGLAGPEPGQVLIGASEHTAILVAAGPEAVILPVDGAGLIAPDGLKAALAASPPGALVAIQLANNETGVIQPIAALAAIVHAAGGALIVDAVQGPGKIALDIRALGADALFLSAHKFGGPKGVGAIIFKDGATRLRWPLIRGGGQERGQRGGTENVPGIVGMGAAAQAVLADPAAAMHMQALRDAFEVRLMALAPAACIAGKAAPRLVNTSCFAIPGLSAEMALIALDLDGVALSSGSACSSGKVRSSHVLAAMGAPDWVKAGALRLSLGPLSVIEEVEQGLAALARLIARR